MGELSAREENVCADCPGSLWGKHSICRVHGCSIGEIGHCHEWDVHEERTLRRDYYLVSAALQQMEEDIKSYAYNLGKIEQLERRLSRMDGYGPSDSPLVARYGIEATLPRGTAGDDYDEVQYEQTLTKLQELRLRVARVDRAATVITDPRDREVLEGMLAGMPPRDIAQQIGVSTRWLREIRLRLIRTMALGNRTNSDLHIDSHEAGGMHG